MIRKSHAKTTIARRTILDDHARWIEDEALASTFVRSSFTP